MRYYSFTVTTSNRSIKNLLRTHLFMGKGRIRSLKNGEDRLFLNGSSAKLNQIAKIGDIVKVDLDDFAGENLATPCNAPLNFVYEDEDIFVLDKSGDIATQGPPEIENQRTIAGAFAHHFGKDKAFHPVNRLDKGTSGLMIIAKNGYIHDRFRADLHEELRRSYLAITSFKPPEIEGKIEAPLIREQSASLKRVVDEKGDYALTYYKTLGKFGKYYLVSVTPYTGRTHQIRAHFAHIGCPLLGDWMYGKEEKEIISRPALHSHTLCFIHPLSGEKMSFTSELPEDMARLLKEE